MRFEFHVDLREYLRRHWKGYFLLVLLLMVAVALANAWPSNSAGRNIAYNVAAGILSLLLFQVFTDYKNIEFMAQVLDRQQLSFHIGARLHESHVGVMVREEAIGRFLTRGDTFRLLTSTGDDYLLPDRPAHTALCDKLSEGVRVEILLFTPVYHLRSYLDSTVPAPTGSVSPGPSAHRTYGQRHRHASELISEHRNTILPAIEKLQQRFPGQVDVRFFHVKHHVNMAIYGYKRIFAAPLLTGTEGRDLPCLEVFPGLVNTRLLKKMIAEFTYLWEKRTLTFSMPQMKQIYDFLGSSYPLYLTQHWMDAKSAGEIESFAHEVAREALIPPASSGS
jgi:hypothetical protein